MGSSAGNVAVAFRSLSKWDYNRILAAHLIANHIPLAPNLFLTVRLYGPSDCRSCDWLAQHERAQQLHAGRMLVRLLDRAIYGTSEPSQIDRFPYFLRLETRSRAGQLTMPHLHLLCRLNPIEEAYLETRRNRFCSRYSDYLMRRHFAPDFMFLPCEGIKVDYLTKYIQEDVQNVFTRELPVEV